MRKKKPLFFYQALLAGAFLCGVAFNVEAAGFAILEQSAEGTGFAYAGSSVGYGDGSSAFFNPAAMTQLNRNVASAGLHVIVPSSQFNDRGSTDSLGRQLTGGGGPNGRETGLVPNLYVVGKVEDFSLGLAINAPFGLANEYDRNYVGRYQGVRSELTTVNFSTSLAYNVTDNLSFGANLGAFHSESELTSAIDFGTIGLSQLGLANASALGLAPQQNDGFVKFEGDDWSLGWGLGALFTHGPNNRNRIGISYRAKSHVQLTGDAQFEVPAEAQILTSTGAFTNGDIRASTTLPESITFGTKQWICDDLALLYESAWTRWSRFEELRIRYDSGLQPDSVTPEDWNNTWRHSIGLQFLPHSDWELRTGFTYDQSAVPNAERRTPRIPDSDRYWLAGGVSYNINSDLRANFSYAHIFTSDERSNTEGPTGDTLRGDWDTSVDIASISLTYFLP